MPCGITTWSFVSLQFFGLAIFVYLLAESTHRLAQAYVMFYLLHCVVRENRT